MSSAASRSARGRERLVEVEPRLAAAPHLLLQRRVRRRRVGHAEALVDRLPDPLELAHHDDLPVGRGDDLARVRAQVGGTGVTGAGSGSAPLGAGPGGGDLVRREVVAHGHRVEHRDVDVLAEPGRIAQAQRGEHPDDAVQTGDRVGHRDLDVDVLGAGGDPAAGGHAGLRMDHPGVRRTVTLRALLPEPRDRQHHEAWVDLHEVVVGEAEAGHDAGPEVLGDDVGPGGEPPHHVPALRRRQVDRDRALAGVLLAEVRALRPLPELPRHVALRRLDLDHVGAEVGEQPAGVRAGEHPAQVEHLDALERCCHQRSLPVSPASPDAHCGGHLGAPDAGAERQSSGPSVA